MRKYRIIKRTNKQPAQEVSNEVIEAEDIEAALASLELRGLNEKERAMNERRMAAKGEEIVLLTRSIEDWSGGSYRLLFATIIPQ